MPTGAARRRFFYAHVQKAAGTELRERLKRNFEPQAMYPDPTDGDLFAVAPQMSATQLLARWEVRKEEIEIVMGHFPVSTAELLGPGFVTMTVLREPVERTLSQLRQYRKASPALHGSELAAIYEDSPDYVFLRNHMVKMFSMTAAEVATAAREGKTPMVKYVQLDDSRLASAKDRIASVDVFGLQDRFDQFCGELESRFGWQLGTPLHANRTEPADVPSELRARIAADNALDVEFYEHARELYERRSISGS
jgi:hypothetical protein